MKLPKCVLIAAFLCTLAQAAHATIVITDFGTGAQNGPGSTWIYTSATSTISGTEGIGDDIYGLPQQADLQTPVALRLTGNATIAPSGSFTITLEDSTGKLATAPYQWSTFIGGATDTQSFNFVQSGFNFANVTGWSLDSGGSLQTVNASFSQLVAVPVPVPEPTTAVLLIAGLLVACTAMRPRVLRPALAAFALPMAGLFAQGFSVPSGYVTVNIKPSPTGTAFAVTQFSAPLQPDATMAGQPSGRISAVTSTGISNSSAGWTAGALANAAAPYFVKIKTGAIAGRIFLITANTATGLTLDTGGTDLNTLSIATGTSGDTYEIFPGLTIRSLLGTPAQGVVGGTAAQFAANQTDKILMNDAAGVTRFYYYDTDFAQWRRSGSGLIQDNLVVSPFAGLSYYRISTTPLSFVFVGKVPDTAARIPVPTSGTTLFASYFPAATTLGALGLNTLPSWRKLGDAGVALENTDRVLAEDAAGVVRSFYYDGTNWKRTGSGVDQSSTAIVSGTAIYTTRFGSGVAVTWLRPLPYNLQQ